MDNMLDLLMEYSKNVKRADFVFFNKVVQEVTRLYDLHDEVQFTDFFDEFNYDDGEYVLMEYTFDDRTINVNNEGLDYCYLDFCKKKFKKDDFDFFTFGEYKILFYNSYLMFVLLHELEHAKQFKLAKDGTGFEGALFRTVFFPLMKGHGKQKKLVNKYSKVYRKRYFGTPEEKLANIRAYKLILEILEPIILSIPDIERRYVSSLYDSYMEGYRKKGRNVVAPLNEYLRDLYNVSNDSVRKRCFSDDFRELLENENLNGPLERMGYGLPISLKEYKYFDDFKKKDKIKTFGSKR